VTPSDSFVADDTSTFLSLRAVIVGLLSRKVGHDREHMFPVPPSDVGDATTQARDKAI